MYRTIFDVLARAPCLFLLMCARGLAAPAAIPAKVNPRVWQDTEHDGSAHFLILLAEQADVKTEAKKHADVKGKRGAVVASLRSTAARTQDGPVEALKVRGLKQRSFWVINAIAAEGPRAAVELLAYRKDVLAIEADRPYKARLEESHALDLTPLSTLASVQPNLTRIKAPDLWALGITGAGIVYANADTGVQWDHPALKGHYRGWNGTSADHNYNWWDAIHSDIDGNGTNPIGFNSPAPADDNGHGTHTMGIGIGDDSLGNQIGVAPGAKWMCCRNMDQGTGRPSTYIECMQFFLAPTDLNGNNPDPDRGADTIGNSYTCPPDELCAPNSLHTMLENMRAAGVFMAVAAGNAGPNCSTIADPPALDDAAITVGASDNSDLIASFISRGPVLSDGSNRRKPDVVAPGVQVLSSIPGGYGLLSGTSMATPHVAGAVALLWSAFPHIRHNVEYTESILEQSALHLVSGQTCGTAGGVPNNVFGYGRIDILAAYNSINRPPFASNQSVCIPGDSAMTITLSASDPEGAPLSFQIAQEPTNGLISSVNGSVGMFIYTPAHAFVGTDIITFRVR